MSPERRNEGEREREWLKEVIERSPTAQELTGLVKN